jgi:hypothetical protein
VIRNGLVFLATLFCIPGRERDADDVEGMTREDVIVVGMGVVGGVGGL